MAGIYERQRAGKLIFMVISIIAIVIFLLISNNLVKDLAAQERERMNIWASATERLAQADNDTDIEFLLSIIRQNNTIPVLVTDSALNISECRNFNLPEKEESDEPTVFMNLKEKNRIYLQKRLQRAANGRPLSEISESNPHFIKVEIYQDTYQYIYYEDSILLKRLSYYPYVQLIVMIILALIIYWALIYSKRAEQNRVWVGLSKETAHQLGTPISSLMAWAQLLEAYGTDPEAVAEINKDIRRLSVITDRFSKIGSVPELKLEYLNDVIAHSLDYMKSRVSSKVTIEMHLPADDHAVMLSTPLFEWVMENLTKNAVDAMEGAGRIDVTTFVEKEKAVIEIRDTGKGIARKNFKTVFNPGFTTKKRGWGLGLTLVKRIVEEYHNGKIFVRESTLGKGTTFRIELPLAK